MGERAERRREEILDAATEAFAARGFGETSMDQIAADVGVTKPRIYAAFESKEELYAACVMRVWSRMGEAIWTAATQPGPADVRLWRGIAAYFDFIEANAAIWRVVYPDIALAGAAATDELRAAQREGVAMMATLFRTGAETERPDAPVEEVVPFAHAFVAAATAIAGWWLDHPQEPKGLQVARLMNFVWMGFGDLLAGNWWQPPESDGAASGGAAA